MTYLTNSNEKATWIADIARRTGLTKDMGPIVVFLATSLAAGLLINTLFPVRCPALSPAPWGAGTHQATSDDISVSPTCAQALVKYADALLIDVRGSAPYSGGHAAGAINIPASQLFEQSNIQYLTEVQATRPIILYCEADCTSSHSIAEKLRQQGWDNVLVIRGGMEAWQEKGLGTETGIENQHRTN